MAAPYSLIRTARRTIGLIVHRDGHVVVRAPLRLPQVAIDLFVAARADWIARARARLAELPGVAPADLDPGDTQSQQHLGRAYLIEARRGLKPSVKLDGDRLVLTLHHPGDERGRARALDRWRRAEAERLFTERTAALMPLFAARGLAPPRLRVRVLRRRWGSMSRDGRMTLALGLLSAPLELIDFVIAHELCHLVHFDHGPAFHALLARIMPDHRARKAALRGFPL